MIKEVVLLSIQLACFNVLSSNRLVSSSGFVHICDVVAENGSGLARSNQDSLALRATLSCIFLESPGCPTPIHSNLRMQYVQQLLTFTMSPISDLRACLLRVFASSTATNNPVGAPAALTDDHPKPHFRTDNDSSDTLTLPDGRKLGYAQYGSLTG